RFKEDVSENKVLPCCSKSADNDGHEPKNRKIESILALIDEWALSRIETITAVDYDAIADKQIQDAELQQLMMSDSSANFMSCTLPSGKLFRRDISTPNIRAYFPVQFQH
ncbi:hypothetical protein TNIN_454531, partial [Trichonephila inaurata madagascariensis]